MTVKAKKIIHNSVIVEDEDIVSAPALQESVKDPPVVLRENLDYVIEGGEIGFVDGLFSLSDPAPDVLWAECAIYSNADTIESNFGRLVDLSQDDLTAKQTRAPYLSAVKGLFFAFTNGPTVANLRLGLQILLGLPFTEERGVILEIQEDFTNDTSGNSLGRVLMEDLDDNDNRTGFRRAFFYPTVVGLETNPVTDVPFTTGDIVDQFTPLSKGAEVQDYVKDPLWWTRALQGIEILKYFTFKVTIDGEIFDSNDVTFAFDFLKAIKPAYTKVIATALLKLEDDIDLDDVLGGQAAMQFYDNSWGLEATNRLTDDNQQGVILLTSGSRPYHTRTVRMLRDMVTFEFGGKVRVSSVAGWDTDLVRPRITGLPLIEGDLVFIHQGQAGASALAPGIYEIDVVIDANTVELLYAAPATDPETFATTPIIAATFEFGSGLSGAIMRRLLNPAVRATDLVTTNVDTVVTSATANFLKNAVGVGDHLVIESGDNQGEYVIDALTPFQIGPPQVPPLFTDTQVKLVNIDGSPLSFQPLTNQSFRVIRPLMQSGTIQGGTIAIGPYAGTAKGAQSIFTGSRIELEVVDPILGQPLDVFTPGMVGTVVGVSNSENPTNDGEFLILGYLNPGRVILDSVSGVSDASRQATLNFN
jgi:hypothetical protein